MELHKVTSRSKETHGNILPLRCQVTYLYDEKIGKSVTVQRSGTMHLVFNPELNIYMGQTHTGILTIWHPFKVGEVPFKDSHD